MIARKQHEDNTPPEGWHIVTLSGGPHHRMRVNVHEREDSITLCDGPTPHVYLRTNGGDTLYHEGIVCAAFKGGGRKR
ncbi:MAG: hypothetical protein WD534_01650 [Phycisphaeraceae bacterium]